MSRANYVASELYKYILRANYVAMRGQADKVSRDAVLQAFKFVAQEVADDEVIQQCQRLCEERALSPHDLACKWQAHVDEVRHRRPVLGAQPIPGCAPSVCVHAGCCRASIGLGSRTARVLRELCVPAAHS